LVSSASDRIAAVIEARGSRRAVLRAYDLFADFYGFWSALFEEKAIMRGLALAQVSPGERVLEVASGPGTVIIQLKRRAGETGRTVGVDLAPRMLRVARRRDPQAFLVRADARSLPFGEGAFDLVWSSYFIDLVPTAELTPLLREFRRVLRPGGRLLLVSLSKKGEAPTWWERFYRITPSWLVPYLFGGCRPIESAPFVQAAGFAQIERQMVSQGLDSEVILGRNPR
jgi:ubiquinone/menaquinone biosynthesis C-methylase UbiE